MKRRRVRLSRDAINDLVNIYDFVSIENPVAARRLVDSIRDKIRLLALAGLTGVARDELSLGLRAMTHRDRCVYFRVTDSHIHVLRVAHGRQNVSSEDFPESDD